MWGGMRAVARMLAAAEGCTGVILAVLLGVQLVVDGCNLQVRGWRSWVPLTLLAAPATATTEMLGPGVQMQALHSCFIHALPVHMI